MSERTLSLLKNFANINPGIIIRAGKKELVTKAIAGNIFARADIVEDFPEDVFIYDVSEFLNSLSLFSEPVLEFGNDGFVMIKEKAGRSKTKYFYGEESIIVTANKTINMPATEINFTLSNENLQKIIKACGHLSLPDMSVVRDDQDIVVRVHDAKNETSNTYEIVVGEYANSEEFNMVFKTENLKMMSDGYDVAISSKLASHWKSSAGDVEYWIALEHSSTFG